LAWDGASTATMVLLHGIGDTAHVWDDFPRRVAARIRIIALDQRGHGLSDHPSPPAYTCEDYVADLERVVDAFQIERMILMGHSMGALHATAFAAQRPGEVRALIHADIEPCPPPWNKKYLTGLYATLPNRYRTLDEYVSFLRKNSPYADEGLLRRHALCDLEENPDGSYQRRYDREVLSHFDHYDLRPVLARITCPTLVIRGAESRVMGAEEARRMAAAIPRGQCVEIPRATHPVHTDNPEGFAQAVMAFLINLPHGGH
ncbi:MAG: alpha/beta hydrolase, partial [Syntrophales bacterium]|nr:alpha/beta hydrolase [Syntrophales bacterium]